LQQSLLGSQVGLSEQIQAEAEAIPESDSKFPQDTPTLGSNWGETNVVRKGIGRMNVPMGQGLPKRPPD
jgi:hypothetical protein